MKADKNIGNLREENNILGRFNKIDSKNYAIDGFTYFSPPLVNRPRCFTYNSEKGCIYCGNKSFRYHSKVRGKKYYQCEKCQGINH